MKNPRCTLVIVNVVDYLLTNPFIVLQGERPLPQKKLDRLQELIEPWFFFSLVWSVGSTGDADSCKRFSAWLKNKMTEEKVMSASLL